MTSIPARTNVAIFGGDSRVHALRGAWATTCHVETYEASDTQAERLAASCRNYNVTHLIVLTRWVGHAQHAKLKSSLPAGVTYTPWRQGIGALRDALPGLVGFETSAVPMAATDDRPIAVKARSVGLTVACYNEEHDGCPFKGKAKSMCGCYCHQDQEIHPEDDELRSHVLEVVDIDPHHGWTEKEMIEFLRLSDVDAPRLGPIIHALAFSGEIDERDGRVYWHTEPEPTTPSPPAPTPPLDAASHATLLAEELSIITDTLNTAYARAETALAALKLEVSAQTPLGEGRFLSFGKLGSAWRLIYEAEGKKTPLLDANREVRLEAVSALPRLLPLLIAEAETQVKAVRARIADIDAFVAALEVP